MKTILILSNKGGTSKSTVCVSLCRVLEDSIILDLDPQETCKELSEHAKQYEVTTDVKAVKNQSHIIVDTGGFFSGDSIIKNQIKKADIIIIPVKPNEPDLLAIRKGVITELEKHREKTFVMFNQVKGVSKSSNEEMIKLFSEVLPDTKRLESQFNDLKSFAKVFLSPLTGKAHTQANALKEELNNIMYK